PEWNPHALLAWRKHLDAHWRSAETAEAGALEALRGGGTLRLVAQRGDEARARRVGEWFAGWVREGLLVVRSRPGT
ncbi:MAG TPA: hypothetical protein VLS49_03540, partial [Usitatibacter sp.]|nr:hypothetical protein [Usitatibacter sp.]